MQTLEQRSRREAAINNYLNTNFPVDETELKALTQSFAYDLENLPVSRKQAFTDARNHAELGNVSETALRIAATNFFESDYPAEEKLMTTNKKVILLMMAEAIYLSSFESFQREGRAMHENRLHSLIRFVEL